MAQQNAPVPPQALEAEEAVLGAIMLNPVVVDRVSEILQPDDFVRESHRKIYSAAVQLRSRDEPTDPVMLAQELAITGDLEAAGGRARLHELAGIVPATANAPHYARIVRDIAGQRGLIRVGQEIARLGFEQEGEAQERIDQAQALVFDLSQERSHVELTRIGVHAREAYDTLIRLHESGEEVIGLSTGFHHLDAMTAGLQPGNLIVLAGRPSMGKSALGIQISAHVVMRDELPVAFFTLEMSETEVTHRLISLESMIDSHRLRTGKLGPEDWTRVTNAVSRIEQAPLYIDDNGAATMLDIRSHARRLKMNEPTLALVVVDYLQMMASGAKAENRVQEVSQISRSLKALARELEVPVLALSQLSRGPEHRHDKRPLLSDLRESGSIEQDADLVMFCYRDEYYNPEDLTVAGLAELIVAKHRNGPTGTVKLTFVKRQARFSDPATPGLA